MIFNKAPRCMAAMDHHSQAGMPNMMKMLRHVSRMSVPALFLAGTAFAQSVPQTLLSNPPQAELRLDGALRLSGQSPLHLDEPLRGEFVLTAEKPGFVRQKARLVFPDNGGPAVPSGASPVNSFGGLIRTLALPGIGQWSEGQQGQGAVLFGSEAMAVGLLLKSDADVRKGQSEYDLAVSRLSRDNSSLSDEDQVRLAVAVLRGQDLVENARSSRKRWAYMAAAAWGYAVVDQAFLRGGLEVRADGLDTLRVRMQRVSRSEAVLRSVFVPGSGQGYAGHDGRSAWLLFGAVGLTAGSIAGEGHLDRTISEYDEALLRRSELDKHQTGDSPAKQSAADEVQRRYSEYRSARRVRNVLWASTAAVWLVNIVDAAVMDIPGENGGFSVVNRPTGMFANIHPGEFRLGYRRGF